MAHTYNVNYVHCAFSTKRRLPLITEPEKVWSTLRNVASCSRINLLAVGGTRDHIHLLMSIPSTRTVSDVVRDMKCNSSLRIRKWNRVFAWQDGYGVNQRESFRHCIGDKVYRAARSASRNTIV
jgi:putative transposase